MVASPGESGPPTLLPVRMLNECVYCPRLFYLMWVHREWADNFFTEDGRDAHRNVDRPSRQAPDPLDPAAIELKTRQLELASEQLGLIAKIDLVAVGDDPARAEPIDYKRGRPPDTPERAHAPERVQVCAQALLLREHGFAVDRGWLYFTDARQRIEVPIDEELVRATLDAIEAARAVAAQRDLPPPLVDSPKCAGCSLHGICLPDEVNALRGGVSRYAPEEPIRQLAAANDDASPLYVSTQGARVGVSGERLEVTDRARAVLAEARLIDVTQLCVFGNVQVTTQAMRRLAERGLPVCLFTYGGWFCARTEGIGHKNIAIRVEQYAAAADPTRSLDIARRLVVTKILNSRTLLRRNATGVDPVLKELRHLARAARRTKELPVLLGTEGLAARVYFGALPAMLRPQKAATSAFDFSFEGRNRRPPQDPVNALLSLAYALLAKDWTITLAAVGLDPYLGYLHQPRYGRPALALDLMEEFRPLIAESTVVTAINTGVVGSDDFVRSPFGVALTAAARNRFIAAYERRMADALTHPIFGYPVSYRRLLELQARLFTRYLLGELSAYPEIRTR